MGKPAILGLQHDLNRQDNPMARQSVAQMSRAERRRLIRKGRKSGEPATAARFLIVAKLAAGQTQAEVSRALELAPSTVSRTAATFLLCGEAGLYDRRATNGFSKVDADFAREVAVVLEKVPLDFGWQRPTWTRELLCLELEKRGFDRVAVCTMGRTLARLGARLGTPKPVVACPWKSDRRRARIAELRALEANATMSEPVFYADEVDIHLNPKVGRDWMLPGRQRLLITPGKNQKYYLAGALDVLTGKLIVTGAERKNSSLFVSLLERLARDYCYAFRIHLIIDNYGIHSSRETRRALAELDGRIVLHFLPPYCPEANRIERVWLDLHANVTRNHRCQTIIELIERAHAFLTKYQRARTFTPYALHAA
jgi:transposase